MPDNMVPQSIQRMTKAQLVALVRQQIPQCSPLMQQQLIAWLKRGVMV